MADMRWCQVPVGLDARRWITRTDCKTVLVAVHTVTAGQRLSDVIRLLEQDRQIQVIFTAAPDVFSNGVDDLLHDLGGVVISWEQATRIEFDLALTAAYGSIHELHAPLIVLPHGAGFNKLAVRRGAGSAAGRGVYGLDPQSIVRGGTVVPAAIALSHSADLDVLGRQCPEALPAAVVLGDPCHDRMLASHSRRASYRRALGVPGTSRLVVAVSTWGTRSLFGHSIDLLELMLSELSPQDRIVALMHPNIWFGHGPRQVRAWLTRAVDRGLGLVPPTCDWLGAVVAADVIVGDHGSLAVYGAAAGVPVVVAGFPGEDVFPGSASALLAELAPRWHADRPLADQLADAQAGYKSDIAARVAARLTSEPGNFNRNMRQLTYRLLGLSEPATTLDMPPAANPTLIGAG
jgi:hypothetical protein